MVSYHFTPNLRLLPLGGVGTVTKNMFIYEFGHDLLLIDCGIGFPDEPGPEEELILPDFSYLKTHQHKIRGLIITHAHFDHYGAVPALLSQINIPIYCSRLTKEFIKKKAEEANLKHLDFQEFDHNQGVKLGCFQVIPFHVNHSVPESMGLMIKTPLGNVFHVADYKFDWTPVSDAPFDLQKACMLASQKPPLLLLSDCLGATKLGHTRSEAVIQASFANLIRDTQGLVVITTVSSNISRFRQAILASAANNRRVSFLGRSVEQSIQIGRELGYFSGLGKYLVNPKKIKGYPKNKLTVVCAGCYGQKGSALEKLATNKHPRLKLAPKDAVIFSADPSPPGTVLTVNRLIDRLSHLGVQVHYSEIQENLHVSGHGTTEDIKMLITMIKPKYLVPIGGDFRHMRAYQLLAVELGYQEQQVLLLDENQVLEFSPKTKPMVK